MDMDRRQKKEGRRQKSDLFHTASDFCFTPFGVAQGRLCGNDNWDLYRNDIMSS